MKNATITFCAGKVKHTCQVLLSFVQPLAIILREQSDLPDELVISELIRQILTTFCF